MSAWSWALALAIAGVLLYLALRGVDWRRVGQIIVRADPGYLLGSLVSACLAIFLRALRWRVILNATAHFRVSTVFWATSAGYLGNNFLPARAGEVIRSVMLSRCSPLSSAYVFTTALTERLMDAIALVLFAALAVLSLDAVPRWILDLSRTVAVVAGAGAVALLALPHVETRVIALLRRVPLPAQWGEHASGVAAQCFQGLRAFHDVRRFGSFILLTLLVWATDVCGLMLGTRALGMTVPVPVALLLLAGLGLGSGLPSTPGYVGIYQFVAVTVLMPFGFRRDDALAYILVAQALSYIVISGTGLIGLAKYRSLKAAARHAGGQ
jgi:glycosyltransferase 2 family protein